MSKSYAYKIYDNAGNYLGQWTDEVISEPSWNQEINSAGSMFDVEIARTENFGNGTDLAIGNYVELYTYYGEFGNWITDLNDDIVDENGDTILFANGSPNGRLKFNGLITRIIPAFGQDSVVATIASRGLELDNTMIEAESNSIELLNGVNITTIGFGNNFYIGNRKRLFQRFVSNTSDNLISIDMAIFGTTFLNIPDELEINLYVASVPADCVPANLIATTTRVVVDGLLNLSNQKYLFETNPYITQDTSYIFVLYSKNGSNTGGDGEYPYEIVCSSPSTYSDGGLWFTTTTGLIIPPPPPHNLIADTNIQFNIAVASGETTVFYSSREIADILREILILNVTTGGVITFTDYSIEDTLINDSYRFNSATIFEGVQTVLELSPSDYYWYVDLGTNILYFKQTRSTPDWYLTKGKEIESLELEESLEEIVNVVYFSGGDTGSGENLFVKRQNATSVQNWGRFIERLSDNRVTVEFSAELIVDSVLNRQANPRFKTTLEINSGVMDIENISVGQMIGFKNFDNYIDDLLLQVVGLSYTPEKITLELDSLLPKISQTVDTLRRQLKKQETLANPDEPELIIGGPQVL